MRKSHHVISVIIAVLLMLFFTSLPSVAAAEAPVLSLTKTAALAANTIPGYEAGRFFSLNLTARTNVIEMAVLPSLDIVLALGTAGSANANAPILYYGIGVYYDANQTDLIVSAKDYMMQGQTYYLSADSTQPITWSSTLNTWVTGTNVPVSATYTGMIYAYTNKSLGYVIQASLTFIDNVIAKSPNSRLAIQSFNSVVNTTPGNVPLPLSVANITLMKRFTLSLATGNNSQSLLAMQAIKTAFDNTRISGILPDRQRVSIFMTGDKPNDSTNTTTVYNLAQYTLQVQPYDVMMFSANVLSTDSTLITFLRNIASDPDRTDMVYPYYLEAGQIGQINNIFTQIVKKVGSKLSDPVVKDFISPVFEVISPVTGLPLQDAAPVATGGVLHIVDGQQWIEWLPPDINSDTNWLSGPIVLRARTSFIGGNYIPTNGAGSGIYMAGSLYGGEFPVPYVNVAPKYPLGNATETIFKRQFSTLNLDTLASTATMKPSAGNPPYQSFGYGTLTFAWYQSDGVTLVSNPASVPAPIANGTSYILKARYTPLTASTDPNAVASVGTPSAPLAKQGTLTISVLSGTLTISNIVNGNGVTDAGQSFIFKIVRTYNTTVETSYEVIQGAGSKTLTDLPIGTYSVTGQKPWSWRYTLSPTAPYSLTFDSSRLTNTATFTNSRTIAGWLSDVAYAINKFLRAI